MPTDPNDGESPSLERGEPAIANTLAVSSSLVDLAAFEDHARSKELILRVQQGDPGAFAEIYDTHADIVYSICMKMLGTEADAEEMLQEVFLRFWTAAHLYRPELGKVVSWIITMTRNRCLNRLRAQQSRRHTHDAARAEGASAPAAEPTPSETLAVSESASVLQAALRELPDDQRTAIEFSFFQGLTHEEIAHQLDTPLGTIKARIRRGLIKLQELLQPYPDLLPLLILGAYLVT